MKKLFVMAIACLLALPSFAQESRFKLIELPYPTNALEPVISQKTVELHHGKHLQGYVNNLNKLIVGTPFAHASLEHIIRKSKDGIFNNAGQLLNHNLYFTQFSPTPQTAPTGKLAIAIESTWGSLDNFKKAFVDSGSKLFGSGWVWLAKDGKGKLIICNYANGGNPVRDGLTPILGFDVWEHAYYLDYQNKRGDHLNALWKIIDWKVVEQRY